jgi:hypothetical protein
MGYRNVGFRAGTLPKDLILGLAKHGYTTIREIQDMFSRCILCERTATIAAVGLDKESWLGETKTGKLEFLLYGLCDTCSHMPDAVERSKAVANSL